VWQQLLSEYDHLEVVYAQRSTDPHDPFLNLEHQEYDGFKCVHDELVASARRHIHKSAIAGPQRTGRPRRRLATVVHTAKRSTGRRR
jgi:hypothetical protein